MSVTESQITELKTYLSRKEGRSCAEDLLLQVLTLFDASKLSATDQRLFEVCVRQFFQRTRTE